jgi:hypothetical protein
MNSRLFNGNISRASNRKIPHLAGAEDLLHCGISIRRLSALGHLRRIDTAPAVAACPLRPSKRTCELIFDRLLSAISGIGWRALDEGETVG